MTVQFSPCNPVLQKLTNKFYKRFKTNVSCNRQDLVFCALNDDVEVIAAVMIREIGTTNTHLLRSLFVAPEYRSQGIAKELCRLALNTHQQTCFTLCEPRLAEFYQTLGFVESFTPLTSAHINKQIQKGLLLLKRRP